MIKRVLITLLIAGISKFTEKANAQALAVNTVRHERHSNSSQDSATKRLSAALRDMEARFGVQFVYKTDEIPDRIISLNTHSGTLEEALESALFSTDLTYKKVRNTYIIRKRETSLQLKGWPVAAVTFIPADKITTAGAAQEIIVSGKVTEENGQSLPGVTVLVKGVGEGTTTDDTGTYKISVSDDKAVLVFSYIGFASQEIAVGSQSQINVTLLPDKKQLGEVVIVGYGTQQQSKVTSAINQVSGEVLENRSLPNITQGLQGFIPNLNLVMGDGKPTQSPTYNIRGNTSIGQGGSALVLIDGAQGDPSLLNPADVASVTVLKDAASASVYGARGAFGVVLITTKNPTKGKTSITYSTNYSIKAPIVAPNYVTNGYTFARTFNDAWSAWNDYSQFPQNVNKTVKFSQAYLAEYKRRNDDPSLPKVEVNPNGEYVYYDNTDWYGILYKKNTLGMDHNIALSGSGEKAGYMITGRYYGQNGLFRYNSDDYKMYTLRAKGNVQLFPWLSVESNIDYSDVRYHNPLNVGEGGGIWRNIADEGHEMSPLFNPDGNLSCSAAYTVGDFIFGKNGIDFITRNVRSRMGATAEFFQKTFRVKGDFTFLQRDESNKRTRVPVPYSRKPNVIEYVGTNTNDIQETVTPTQYLAGNIYTEYENTFKHKHYCKAMAGFNSEQSTTKGLSTNRNDVININAQNINMAVGTSVNVVGVYEQWNIRGGFFRLNYGYDDRYIIEVNGRYDGSSKFPSHKRYAFFPSLSAGWNVSQEKFWKVPRTIISNLKIRASYGSLGNGSIASYSFIEQFKITQSDRALGGVRPQTTSQPNVLPANLTWEKATTTDVGVDVSFLENRLQISFDRYVRATTDMFTKGPTLPAVFGTRPPQGNYADLKTNGWEAVAAWRDKIDISGKPMVYGIRLSLSDYQAVITRYNNPTKLLSDYYEGQKVGEIWGYVTDGFFTRSNLGEASKQADFKSSNSGTTLIGDIKFADLNEDGVINRGNNTATHPGDRRIIGNSQPRYNFGTLFDFNWHNFFVSAFFQGVGKQDWWPGAEADAFWGPYNRPYNRVPADMVNQIWSEQNPDAYFPRLRGYIAVGSGRPLYEAQSKYLQNVAYVRLKNLQIGYNFSKTLIHRLRLAQARCYLSADNIWTYSPMYKVTRNFDVENIQGSDRVLTDGSGGNGNNYPILKGFTVGLTIGF